MALAVPVGAFVAARRAGGVPLEAASGMEPPEDLRRRTLMGGSALIAEGCNINQGLTNSSTLAVGSLLTFASMAAGAWGTVWAST